jgi:hypothetical protein
MMLGRLAAAGKQGGGQEDEQDPMDAGHPPALPADTRTERGPASGAIGPTAAPSVPHASGTRVEPKLLLKPLLESP